MTLILPVFPKLAGVELAASAAVGLTQTYRQTPKSLRRMMNGDLKAQENFNPKITTDISGTGWFASGWDGIDQSSSLVLSCGEAKTIASTSNVITISPNRRSDVALRTFAFINGEWISRSFGISVDTVTVAFDAAATQYMVGFYPEFAAFVELVQNGRQSWTLTAEEV